MLNLQNNSYSVSGNNKALLTTRPDGKIFALWYEFNGGSLYRYRFCLLNEDGTVNIRTQYGSFEFTSILDFSVLFDNSNNGYISSSQRFYKIDSNLNILIISNFVSYINPYWLDTNKTLLLLRVNTSNKYLQTYNTVTNISSQTNVRTVYTTTGTCIPITSYSREIYLSGNAYVYSRQNGLVGPAVLATLTGRTNTSLFFGNSGWKYVLYDLGGNACYRIISQDGTTISGEYIIASSNSWGVVQQDFKLFGGNKIFINRSPLTSYNTSILQQNLINGELTHIVSAKDNLFNLTRNGNTLFGSLSTEIGKMTQFNKIDSTSLRISSLIDTDGGLTETTLSPHATNRTRGFVHNAELNYGRYGYPFLSNNENRVHMLCNVNNGPSGVNNINYQRVSAYIGYKSSGTYTSIDYVYNFNKYKATINKVIESGTSILCEYSLDGVNFITITEDTEVSVPGSVKMIVKITLGTTDPEKTSKLLDYRVLLSQ